MREIAEAWESRLRQDLAGFADRTTEPSVERDGSTIHAAWLDRTREKSEIFVVDMDSQLRWKSSEGDASYKDFLRSEGMADFEQLARAIGQNIPEIPSFVAGDCSVSDGVNLAYDALADGVMLSELIQRESAAADDWVDLNFLKGDPGAGKTTLLKYSAGLQAQRYLNGDSDFLFFFVSAQGRELSNLRDAFSGELDDLRAGFTRDAIPALVRNGLLVPMVDGFDELLGTAGYGGAFGSLQSLLTDLDGMGTMVVSARSAFYDLEFLSRSSTPLDHVDLRTTTINLEPWTEQQLEQYLDQGNDTEVSEALRKLSDQDRNLLRRPFFASEFPTFVTKRSGTEQAGASLLAHLIDAYISREAEKIVDGNGDPVLPVDGHRRLFELVAAEMWETEVRKLALEDLRELTDLVSEEFDLDSDGSGQLRTKASSYAGLRQGESQSREEFSFEHEVYFDYFLSLALAAVIAEQDDREFGRFLDRAVIPESVASEAVRKADDEIFDSPTMLTCATGPKFENRQRNLGALLVGAARENGAVKDVEGSNLKFVDISLKGCEFSNVHFTNCEFVSARFDGAEFVKCDAESSTFHAISVDDESSLDISGLVPGSNFGSVHHPGTGDLFAPKDIGEILIRLGAPKPERTMKQDDLSTKATGAVNALQHLARAYRRTNIVFESTDDGPDKGLERVFKSPFWSSLKRILVDSGVVMAEKRQTSGPNVEALRLRVPAEDLMAGQTTVTHDGGPVDEMWKAIRQL